MAHDTAVLANHGYVAAVVVDEVAKALESAEEMAVDLDKVDAPYTDKSLQQLVSWLNFHVMQTRIKASPFPQDIIDSHGRLAVEAIEFMSGRTLNNKVGR